MKKIIIVIYVVLLMFIICGLQTVFAETDIVSNETDSITNPSVEDSLDKQMPKNWSNNCWGNNSTTFTYLNKGHSGKHSLKIEVSEYVDGDAKWIFEPIKLAPGDYLFKDFYKSDVETRLVVAITKNTGEIEYIDLPDAPASKKWKEYQTSFEVPEYAHRVSVYHLISKDGYLITDDYSIAPYTYKGFHRGMVTITFDDGWEENTYTALPIMQKFGFKSNQFYATWYIQNPRVDNPRMFLKRFMNAGHEIGSHSVTHPYLTTLPVEEMKAELRDSRAYLQDFLDIDIKYFATPFGDYDTVVNKSIMDNYVAHRTAVERGYNSYDNFDVSRLKSMSVLVCTSAQDIEKWVSKAKDERLWLILLYHRVADDPNEYDTTPEEFFKHMKIINDYGLPVVTFSEALEELNEFIAFDNFHYTKYTDNKDYTYLGEKK